MDPLPHVQAGSQATPIVNRLCPPSILDDPEYVAYYAQLRDLFLRLQEEARRCVEHFDMREHDSYDGDQLDANMTTARKLLDAACIKHELCQQREAEVYILDDDGDWIDEPTPDVDCSEAALKATGGAS